MAAALIASPTRSWSHRSQLRLLTAHLQAENPHEAGTLHGYVMRAADDSKRREPSN
jgi:hypothetical protein